MNEENLFTAKDLFFQTLHDTDILIIMSYQIDLIEEISDELKRKTLIICPENNINHLLKLGFVLENIFQLPKAWNSYQEIHGKIFVQIKRDEVVVFFGSSNFTYAGMCRNFETYCRFTSQLKIPITIENLERRKDISFWANCTDELSINSILDLLNHIFSNSKDNSYLSEEYFINTRLQSYFLHTAGKNTLKEGLILALKKNENIDPITIRIFSPYTSASSLVTFVSFFRKYLNRPFKIEILTNYLPDFQNYYDSSGFIDPEQYENIKQESKRVHNVDIEMRFWSTEGTDEIPGNFIHSKIYFITSNIKKEHVFILSSANFSNTAWGLEDSKNLEVGYIEFQKHKSQKIYDFFSEFWRISISDELNNLNKIALVRKKIVNKELISEIPFREFFSKIKVKGRHNKSPGNEVGTGLHRLLKIEAPREEFIEEFLKGTIKINLKEYSPEINALEIEINLSDITNQSKPTKLDYNLKFSEKKEYSLNLENVKKDIKLNQYIDSIIIRAKTNISANDIQIRTDNWGKVESENIGNYLNNKICFYNFSKYKHFNTTLIHAFLISDKTFSIDSCKIDNFDIVITIPKNVKIEQIKSIMIRQTQREYLFRTILFHQPHLKFEEEPIKEISLIQEVIDEKQIQMLQIKASKKWMDLDLCDFIFSHEGIDIWPICVSKKDDANYNILSYGFNDDFEDLNVSLLSIFGKYFGVTSKIFSYLITSNHKKGMNEITKDCSIDINIIPKDPDETTPIKIFLRNNSKNTFGIEYKVINGRLFTYERPKVETFQEPVKELNLGTLKPGQILVYRPFIKIGNFRIYTQGYKELIIKNRLIDNIEAELPFENHMRILNYSKIITHHFLFSIELKFKTKYSDAEKDILDARIKIDNKEYNFIKVKSKLFHKDIFYIFLKINSLTDLEGSKKILVFLNTSEPFSDFYKEIIIYYKKTNNGIILKVNNDEKFIENGNKGMIVSDEFSCVNFPLFDKSIKEKPSNMEFIKYEGNLSLDTNEIITPVWFIGYQ